MLPFDPYPGKYRWFVYDIEIGGTLASGVGYPAITDELVVTGKGQGSNIMTSTISDPIIIILSSCDIIIMGHLFIFFGPEVITIDKFHALL